MIRRIIQQPEAVLVLAGDVGYPFSQKYRQFLKAMDEAHDRVFLIAGNHEFYSDTHSVPEIKEQIKNVCSTLPNTSFLDNSVAYYAGYQWVGTTVPEADAPPISDIVKIRDYDPPKWHAESVRFLEKELATSGKESIVITHHMPSPHLILPKYRTPKMEPYHSWFAASTSMEHLFLPHVRVWCYGHTHGADDRFLGQTRFVCNPVGYPGENAHVDLHKVVDLKIGPL